MMLGALDRMRAWAESAEPYHPALGDLADMCEDRSCYRAEVRDDAALFSLLQKASASVPELVLTFAVDGSSADYSPDESSFYEVDLWNGERRDRVAAIPEFTWMGEASTAEAQAWRFAEANRLAEKAIDEAHQLALESLEVAARYFIMSGVALPTQEELSDGELLDGYDSDGLTRIVLPNAETADMHFLGAMQHNGGIMLLAHADDDQLDSSLEMARVFAKAEAWGSSKIFWVPLDDDSLGDLGNTRALQLAAEMLYDSVTYLRELRSPSSDLAQAQC